MAQQPAGGVTVFAPSPILTVTLEAAGSHDTELHLHPGGQGFWIARMVAGLGEPVTFSTALGGETGRVLHGLIEAEGVTLDAVPMSATNGAYVHDRRTGERRVIAEVYGRGLDRHEADDLCNRALVSGLESAVTVLAGRSPKAVAASRLHGRLAKDLRANGRYVVADLGGESLTAALEGGVDLLKISDEELQREGYTQSDEVAEIVSAMERLNRAGARRVLISRASEPALVLVDQRVLEVVGPRIEPLDFRGAGDSMTAALAVAVARGLGLEDTFRLGAASGALNVTRHGLGTGSRADIERMAKHIVIRELGRR